MDREEREVGVNSVGESRMDKTEVGGSTKKVKGIGNGLKHEEAALDQ